jgi:hypothetical protein
VGWGESGSFVILSLFWMTTFENWKEWWREAMWNNFSKIFLGQLKIEDLG